MESQSGHQTQMFRRHARAPTASADVKCQEDAVLMNHLSRETKLPTRAAKTSINFTFNQIQPACGD